MRWALLFVLTACWHDAVAPETPHAEAQPPAPPTKMILAGNEVRGPGEAPSIELTEALVAAQRYADKHDVHLPPNVYLQGAVFDSTARQWVFDWQVATTKHGPVPKGGITIITVHESGQITINYGE
jgi:hypothetical protein